MLLPRGVYCVPALNVDGGPILVAVNGEHQVIARREIPPTDDPCEALDDLWDLLEQDDPPAPRWGRPWVKLAAILLPVGLLPIVALGWMA